MKILLRFATLLLETLIVPVLLLSMLIGALYFLTDTTPGLQASIKLLNKAIPGELVVQHAHGKLLSKFVLTNVTYRSHDVNVDARSIELQWQPRKLLEGQLAILHFYASNVAVQTAATQQPSKPFDYSAIPFYLQHTRISQAAITHLTYQDGDKKPLVLNAMNLQQHAAEDFSFSAESPSGSIQGTLAQNWDAQWHFKLPDLSIISPQAHGNATLIGTLTGPRWTPTIVADLNGEKLSLNTDSIQQLHANIHLTIKPDTQATATITASGINVQQQHLQSIALNARGSTSLSADQYTTTASVDLNNKPMFNVLFALPKKLDINHIDSQPLNAKLNINAIDLQTLAHYAPMVKNVQGSMVGSLEMHGTLQSPKLTGEISITHGNVSLPSLGITLKNIALRAVGNENKLLNYAGTLQSGTGTATLKGQTDFSRNDFPTTVSLQGANLELVNLEEYKALASPDLTLTLANKVLSIHGNVFIPSAKIAPKNFTSVVTLPADVVFVGQENTKKASALDFLPALQITVTLGDKIYIHYQDLEAQLKGKVDISKDAHSPATGTGELYTAKGTYSAYKKVLTITQGRLLYTGNVITNPGLNIKASREMKTVATSSFGSFSSTQAYMGEEMLTVGVQVLGTLEKPVISLFSSPSLSQVDILSYLVLGIPSSQAQQSNGANSQALLTAASALNLGGNGTTNLGSITQHIQKTFGLSEMNIESVQSYDQSQGTVGKTSLVLGKQITPKLSIHYSTSFDQINPVSSFNIRYKLSKRFSIQSETSTMDTGADLLYSIERG